MLTRQVVCKQLAVPSISCADLEEYILTTTEVYYTKLAP